MQTYKVSGRAVVDRLAKSDERLVDDEGNLLWLPLGIDPALLVGHHLSHDLRNRQGVASVRCDPAEVGGGLRRWEGRTNLRAAARESAQRAYQHRTSTKTEDATDLPFLEIPHFSPRRSSMDWYLVSRPVMTALEQDE